MNRAVEDAVGRVVNRGQADDPFPLTPALSLGEREHQSSVRLMRRFMVPMHVSGTLELSMNRRMNMPLLRSLKRVHGASWAIDMALLRSFSNRFKVPMHARSETRLSMNHRTNMALLRSFSNRFMVPMRISRISELPMNERGMSRAAAG
jgi:hypothetical protein